MEVTPRFREFFSKLSNTCYLDLTEIVEVLFNLIHNDEDNFWITSLKQYFDAESMSPMVESHVANICTALGLGVHRVPQIVSGIESYLFEGLKEHCDVSMLKVLLHSVPTNEPEAGASFFNKFLKALDKGYRYNNYQNFKDSTTSVAGSKFTATQGRPSGFSYKPTTAKRDETRLLNNDLKKIVARPSYRSVIHFDSLISSLEPFYSEFDSQESSGLDRLERLRDVKNVHEMVTRLMRQPS
ncbi:hypothetical protein HDE_00881 [Halotydeus destructor]|nr:hypothetical protein HDE_00881 [Halotydeus destructor]